MSVDGEQRPDPDALLRVIEKQREGKGKVKIFFGMAAGVGKTYAMLQEARRKRQEGIDVVIGYLESHQRKETDAARRRPRDDSPDDAHLPGQDAPGNGH